MKILIATPLSPAQSGGPAQYASGLSRALSTLGHQVETVSFADVARYPSGVRHLILGVRLYVCAQRADAVIVLDTLSSALPAVIAARLRGKAVFVRAGGDFVWEQYVERTGEKVLFRTFYEHLPPLSMKERLAVWIQKRIVFPLTSAVVFNTKWQRDIWMKPYELTARRVSVIENAYAWTGDTLEEATKQTDVVWVGRNLVLKNTDALDRAVEAVRRTVPSLTYEKHTSIPHTDVLMILKRSRMLVIPSVSEMSPNLAAEALALGTPVVLTKECGLQDTLGDAVTWIDPMRTDDIAEKIMGLMTDEGYRNALMRAEKFTSERTYETVAREFLALLP